MWNRTKIASVKAQRGHARAAVEALARLSNDNRVLGCVIEDLSASGARLRLEEEAAPHLFGPGWTLTSSLVGALPLEIRWRNLDQAGVSFVIGQEQRARLNRLVKAMLRYGLAETAIYPTPDHRRATPPLAREER